MEWLVIACILSECTWHETTVVMSQQLSGNCWLCNCILQIARSATFANALPLHKHHVVFVVPRLLIKRLLLEMPERAKMFAFACMLTLIVNWFGKLHIRVFWAAY